MAAPRNLVAHLALPRNCREAVVQLLRDQKIKATPGDERPSGRPISAPVAGRPTDTSNGRTPSPNTKRGSFLLATSFGKTVIAANLIARPGVNTLVLVHWRQLLNQSRERLSIFLEVPVTHIRQIVGSKTAPTGTIDVALIQSLSRRGEGGVARGSLSTRVI